MKSLEELQAIRERMKSQIQSREQAGGNDIRVVVGMATCGIAAGARAVLAALTEETAKSGLSNVKAGQTGCVGICAYEPIVEVFFPGKEKVTYVLMDPDKMRAVFKSHVLSGQPIQEYTYTYAIADKGEK
ncbi:MAG: (2Fe-2S) ferredoxin domain-containing protein [Firmicutes bacterium]|nr:(2Fe-2S) ferredoxin domain-containing protein [Bacillota bacterium]